MVLEVFYAGWTVYYPLTQNHTHIIHRQDVKKKSDVKKSMLKIVNAYLKRKRRVHNVKNRSRGL